MTIKIKQIGGHYMMYVNGIFYGSYDSIREVNEDRDLLEEMEELRQNRFETGDYIRQLTVRSA